MVSNPSGSRKEGRDRLPTDRTGSKRDVKDPGEYKGGEYKGLCVNCAYRETCLLPKSEGGVWHCGEFVEEG
jgi:hypothetical protein